MANEKFYADYLMHGRTKGSKNGISTTPGYIAKGKKAVGQLINGVYVYANNAANAFKPKQPQQNAAKKLIGNLSGFAKNQYNNIPKPQKPKKAADKVNAQRFVSALTNNPIYGAGKSFVNNVAAVNKQKKLIAEANASYNKNQKFENRPARFKYTNYGVDKLAKKAEQQARLMNEANASYKKQQIYNSGNPANNWQEQGNNWRAITEYLNKKTAKEKAQQEHAHQNAANQANAEREAREKAMAYASKTNAANSAASAHQNAVNQAKAEYYAKNAARYKQKNASKGGAYKAGVNAANQAEAERQGRNSAYEYSKKHSAASAHQNAVNQSNAERAALNAIANRSSAKSAHQNAVNQANAERYARDNAFYNSSSHKSFNDWKYDKKLEANKKRSELAEATKAANYEANQRNTRSDIGNAWEDLKQDAKNTFKALKSKKKKKK